MSQPILRVVALEKRSGIAFVRRALEAQARGKIVMPLEADSDAHFPGVHIDQRLASPAGGGWFSEPLALNAEAAPAQISLTSGTTGARKPILLSHRTLADVTTRLLDAQQLDASVREYLGVPATYSFGMGRVRAVCAAGGALYLPESGFRVEELARMLEDNEVNALSAVPTLLRLVLSKAEVFRELGRKLRWLEIGSQAMNAAEKAAVRDLFPNARIVQHYGLTEASRTTFLNVSEASVAQLESVGRPTGAVEVRIRDDGLICIRGPHVADGVVTENGVEALADSAGWLHTRDLGAMSDGFLRYEGRADHLINVAGIKTPAEVFEAMLVSRMGAAPFAVAAGADRLRGQVVVVAYEPNNDKSFVETLETAALSVGRELGVGDGVSLFPVAAIPKTDTLKVKRGEISAQFDARAQNGGASSQTESCDPAQGVRDSFTSLFRSAGKLEHQSFVTIGGDSLQFVRLSTRLEKHFRNLPADWAHLPIGALAERAAQQQAASESKETRAKLPENLEALRALACVLIVALHVVGVDPNDGLKLPASSPWHSAMAMLTSIRLPLFTALAGFLYAALPAEKNGYIAFMSRKLRLLLRPLLFATLAFWGLAYFVLDEKDSLFWAVVDGYRHLWYIHALLLIFAVAALIDVKVSRDWRLWLAIGFATALLHRVMPDIPIMHMKNAVFQSTFFAFGIVLFRAPRLRESPGALAAALSIAGAGWAAAHLAHPPLQEVGALEALVGGAWFFALLRLFPSAPWLAALAPFSFTIYLWHPMANAAVRMGLNAIGVENVPLLFGIGLAAGVGLPVLVHVIAGRLPRSVSAALIGS